MDCDCQLCTRSIEMKMRYVKEQQLGGAMLWSLDMDDFTGSFCAQGKYPILSTINFYLGGGGKSIVELPSAELLWKKSSVSSGSSSSAPTDEASLLISAEAEAKANGMAALSVQDRSSSSTSGRFNVFGLLQKDGKATFSQQQKKKKKNASSCLPL